MVIDLPKRVADAIGTFTGRTWLLPLILEWLDRTNTRTLVIQGWPGAGKSMVAAWLSGAGPEATEESGSQLRRIRAHVKAAHFCVADTGSIAPKLFAQHVAEQLNRSIAGFAKALTSVLGENLIISGQATAGRIEPGGVSAGVYLNQLNVGDLSDERLFNRLVREPLQVLYRDHDKPIIIVVDALDEAQTYKGSPTIVRLLARMEDLPPEVRFVITTRPDRRVLKYYQDAKYVDLLGDPSAGKRDIRQYAFDRLAAVEPQQRILLADQVTEAAEGNFLFAHLVLADLLARRGMADIDSLKLPQGLGGIYHEFLNRELGADEERWYREFKPVLGLIAVAQGEGLNRAQLASIIGSEVEQPIRICMQYLDSDNPEGPFRIFHRSFVDFLLADKHNTDYHIDPSAMHSWLADSYLARYAGRWDECDAYGLGHLPLHLYSAARLAKSRELQDKLTGLLADFDFIRGKIERLGVDSLLADYEYGLENPDVRAIKAALSLSAFNIKQDSRQLPGQLTGRLLSQSSRMIGTFVQQVGTWRGDFWLRPKTRSLTSTDSALVRILRGHEDQGTAAAVSADGTTAVTAASSPHYDLKVWDLKRQVELHRMTGHTDTIWRISISSDGRIAATASQDGTVRIWDLIRGREKYTLRGHRDRIFGLDMTRDGRLAISASRDSTLKLWDVEGGLEIGTLTGHSKEVKAVVFMADGRMAVSTSYDDTAKIWDIERRCELDTLRGDLVYAHKLAISADGRRILTDSRPLRVWDLEMRRELWKLEGHTATVSGIGMSADGRRGFSASMDNSIRIWDLDTGMVTHTFVANTGTPYTAAMSPNGRDAVSVGESGAVSLWSLPQDNTPQNRDGGADLECLSISEDGRLAIVADSKHLLRVYDVEGRQLHVLEGHSSRIFGVAISFSRGRAVSASSDRTLRVWDTAGGVELLGLRITMPLLEGIGITQDASRAFWALRDNESLSVWDLETARNLGVVGCSSKRRSVRSLAPSADGSVAVGITIFGEAMVFDTATGCILRYLSLASCNCAAISADGRRAAAGFSDGTMRIWDVDTGTLVWETRDHTRSINGVSLSASGQTAASVSTDHSLRLSDVEARRCLAAFYADTVLLKCALTADGTSAVVAAESGIIHFLDLMKPAEVAARLLPGAPRA